MLHKLLLIFIIASAFIAKSQTLYWVGGNGNFHDGSHWSLKSGGEPAGILPSANSHVIFDDESSSYNAVISVTQHVEIASITSNAEDKFFELTGASILNFNIHSGANINTNFIYSNSRKL